VQQTSAVGPIGLEKVTRWADSPIAMQRNYSQAACKTAALVCGINIMASATADAQAQACFAYVANNDPSISIYSVDATTGSLDDAGTTSLGPGISSFSLAIDASQTLLYVGTNSGSGTWGFAIDPDTGALTPLAGSPFPVFNALSLAVDPTDRFLVVAEGARVSSYRIDAATGGLDRSDSIGGGTPWSLTFDPSGRYVYVANVNANTVSAFQLNADTGALSAVPGSPFAAGANPFRVVAEPSGRFLYVSNVNGSSLSVYRIDGQTGALSMIPGSPVPTGPLPEAIAIDPVGRYLYVANYHNIDGFSIDADSGVLVPLETSPFPAGDSTAQDLQMDPSGQFLYAANHDSGAVTVLAVDSNTGELTPSSAAPSPGFPLAIALLNCTR
jgi:6-phosphogluconolactonase